MFKLNNYNFVIAFSATLLLAACSSKEPTFGEMVVNEGASMQSVGEDWNKGTELISDGQRLVANGKKEVKDGKNLVESGTSKIREGQEMISYGQQTQIKAEQKYQNRN